MCADVYVCALCDHGHLLKYATHIYSKLTPLYVSLSFPLLIFSPCEKGSYLGVPGLALPAQAWLLAGISPQEQHVLYPKDSLLSHTTPLLLSD